MPQKHVFMSYKSAKNNVQYSDQFISAYFSGFVDICRRMSQSDFSQSKWSSDRKQLWWFVDHSLCSWKSWQRKKKKNSLQEVMFVCSHHKILGQWLGRPETQGETFFVKQFIKCLFVLNKNSLFWVVVCALRHISCLCEVFFFFLTVHLTRL